MELIHKTHVFIFLCAWFVTNFEPLTRTLHIGLMKLPLRFRGLFEPLFCFKCLTLWSILLITQDVVPALLFSFIASWYDKDN